MFSFLFSNPPFSKAPPYNISMPISAPNLNDKMEPTAPTVPTAPKVNTNFNSWFGVSIGYSASLFGKPSTPPTKPASTTIPTTSRIATPSTIATNSKMTITKKGLFNW
jgi:hypothetical protein